MPKTPKWVVETDSELRQEFESKRMALMFKNVMIRDWKASAGHSVKWGMFWTGLYRNNILVMKIRLRKIR